MNLKGILVVLVSLAVAGVAVADANMGYSKPKSVDVVCAINSADVSWDGVEDGRVSGYDVYSRVSSEPIYTRENLFPIETTQFTVLELPSGLTYDFGVTAVYDDGGESDLAGPVTCTVG